MAEVQELAEFVVGSSLSDLSVEALEQLEIRILDSLGTAIGALDGEPIRHLRRHLRDFGGAELCTLIGGGRTAPDRAALYNGALVRYLDYNDSYLAPGETCHPSDNLGAVLAAAEYAGADGTRLLEALAVAYQVHCRLSDEAPVRKHGFDHTTQGAYAVAAGVAKALGLDVDATANAVAISGTCNVALRVTRTGALSHWKGLAFPNTAFVGTHAAFLASRGITGPEEVFEGNKGFRDSIAGEFSIDWGREDLERVTRTILKKYNAEIHSQSAIEAALRIREDHDLDPASIAEVEIETFDVAHDIIGGGEEGDKTRVRTKEEADHSLPYMVAVALIDGAVGPDQYEAGRIVRDDVQGLLRRVRIRPSAEFSDRFPEAMPCRLAVVLDDGTRHAAELDDYEGFHTRPMGWDTVIEKFRRLAGGAIDRGLQDRLVSTVRELRSIRVAELAELLARVTVRADRDDDAVAGDAGHEDRD